MIVIRFSLCFAYSWREHDSLYNVKKSETLSPLILMTLSLDSFSFFFFFDKASCKNIIHSSSRGNDPQTDTRRKTVINYKSMFIFCSSINSFFRSFVLILRDIVIIATSSSFFWPISTNRILYPK